MPSKILRSITVGDTKYVIVDDAARTAILDYAGEAFDPILHPQKTLVGLNERVEDIEEIIDGLSAGIDGSAIVTISTDTTTSGALKSYTIKQNNSLVGVIDIPKDMVVKSGEVVVNPEGQKQGTYIKLVLANVAEPLYINVGTLVDIYQVSSGASQVQLEINSSTREISATIVAGSISTLELKDGAVTTDKLSTRIQ